MANDDHARRRPIGELLQGPADPPRPPPSYKDRWNAFVTQTDWQGPIMQESWYGHHYPCRRIAMFVQLSAMISTLVMAFRVCQEWPILHPFLTTVELNRIKQSHADCAHAICQAVHTITLDCRMVSDVQIVMERRFPAHLDRVALPDECHDALQRTFGEDFESNLLTKSKGDGHWSEVNDDEDNGSDSLKQQIDLIHFGDLSSSTSVEDEEEAGVSNVPLFRFLPGECFAEESLLKYLFLDDMIPGSESVGVFLGSMDFMDDESWEYGQTHTIQLRSLVCPEHMSPWMKHIVVRQSIQIYDLFVAWRQSGVLAMMYWLQMAYHSAMCATRLLYVSIPGCVMWFLLPNKEVRGKRKSFLATIATLLLLTTLAEEGTGGTDEGIRTAILVGSALLLGNVKAATEWTFLYFLSYMDLQGLWLEYSKVGSKVELSGFLGRLVLILWFLIPGGGDGLWMLVTIYVVYMAFPSQNHFGRREKEE